MTEVTIYTDGAARGNPDGPGGYGAVLLYTDPSGKQYRKELSEGFAKTTNNRMELMAVIAALETLKRPCDVTLYSDSKYVTLRSDWSSDVCSSDLGWTKADRKPVLNRDLWERLLAAAAPHRIRWVWVRGHNGNRENERCDALATAAADALR